MKMAASATRCRKLELDMTVLSAVAEGSRPRADGLSRPTWVRDRSHASADRYRPLDPETPARRSTAEAIPLGIG